MISSKYFPSFLIIFGLIWMVQCTTISPTSTTTDTQTTRSGRRETSTTTTIKSEGDKTREILTVQLIENSSLLSLHFYPKEETLEITVKFDLEAYKKSNYSLNKKSSNTTKNSKDGGRAKKINIGFDRHEGKFVDVISISLLPFEETEKETRDQRKTEQTTGSVIGNDHVQDFHWNKNDGLLVPDSVQNYELITFDVAKNQTILSTTISRPWLTCDNQDIQFSLKQVEIWWMLEMSESPTNSSGKKSANLKNENSTKNQGTTRSPPENSTSYTSTTTDSTTSVTMTGNNLTTRTSGKNITLIDKNVTSQGRKDEESPNDVEVFKSIKDYDFHGPVLLSMEKLLGKLAGVFIKGCPATKTTKSGKNKEKPQLVFNCSLKEYKGREDIQTHLRIVGLVSIGTKKSFTEIEPEPCPISFDNKTTTLFNALTSGNALQPKNNEESRQNERNSATLLVNFPFSLTFLFHTILFLMIIQS